MSQDDLSPEFHAANKRRLELLEKQFSGFTKEESYRRYDKHPGWKEECERRYHKNLTDEERAELKKLTDFVDEEINKAFPLPDLKELEKRLRQKKETP